MTGKSKQSSMNRNASADKILMIGLDAAEVNLIERWCQSGDLPNIAALRAKGFFTPLTTTADWLVGSPWPTFYTSTWPSEHGFYHYLTWCPELMATVRPNADWLPLKPFWRELGQFGKRVVSIDVPLTYAPEPFDGVEISGWATHELLVPPAAYPASTMEWIEGHLGASPRDDEEYVKLPATGLLDIRDQLTTLTERAAELGLEQMREQSWDLFLLCFSATHRAGHKLWGLDGLAGEASPPQQEQLRNALKEVYIACDTAIGRLVQAAGDETSILLFSLHGMGANNCRCDILPAMLNQVLAPKPENHVNLGKGLSVKRLREAIPERLRSQIKNRLPMEVQDRLTAFWRTGGMDWPRTRAFAMFSDLYGYVRINVQGRESAGIVTPGPQFEQLCEQISEGLYSFVDADTGEPVVEDITHGRSLYPNGIRQSYLPDLIVRWNDQAASKHRQIVSPLYADIDWPTPGSHPSGRSGNHRGKGFLIASGPGIVVDKSDEARAERFHIMDLAPTVYQLLNQPVPKSFQGKPIFKARTTPK